MNWSLHDARALERFLVSWGAPRDLAWRAAFLDGAATRARVEEIRLAAEPYLGQVMRRLWRLQERTEDGPP